MLFDIPAPRFILGLFLVCLTLPYRAYAGEDWLTYRSPSFGLEVKYPKNWVLAQREESGREKTLSFEVNTHDPDWVKRTKSDTAPLFQIEIYNRPSYDTLISSCRNEAYASSFCIRLSNIHHQNTKYVFVIYNRHSAGFDVPQDISDADLDLADKSIKTLKISDPVSTFYSQ